jgi:molybdate transport system ATP-binding protein
MIDIDISKTLRSSIGQMELNVNAVVDAGEFMIIQGKSGAGKTSLLRMIAGLLTPDRGSIRVMESAWFDDNSKINKKPQDRNIGYVFQDYALFPNMTVKGNLEFAAGKDHSKIDSLLEMMELGSLQNRRPNTLSGGQQQRVALARALVLTPKVLLLDEPLSALDHEMRSQLQQYLINVHREFGLTTLMVSHDVSEALKMADKVMVLEEGTVTQYGPPSSLFGDQSVSGKFQFTGTVIAVEKQGFLAILSILIGKDVVKVIADEDEATNYQVGDKVLVASKAWNPIIKKL